jgi:hypothetical protein
MGRTHVVFIALAAISLSGFLQTVSAQRKSHLPNTAHELAISYWTVEAGWSSQLEVGSNLAEGNVEVSPILYTAGHQRFELPAITLAPGQLRTLDVADALAAASNRHLSGPDLYGSLVLHFNSIGARNIYAAVLVQKPGHPMNFHFDAFITLAKSPPGRFESVWWLPRRSTQETS